MINAGVVPRLIYFLSKDNQPQLQFEALWALTNIASGNSEETSCVVDNGAIPQFIRLLESPSIDVADQGIKK